MTRLSIEHALKLHLISEDEANMMHMQNGHHKRSIISQNKLPQELRPKTPHELLWNEIHLRFGDRAVLELKNIVPGRNFRADIAFPKERLIVEVDGWQYHGKFKTDFQKDKIRQNLLTINNWRILRYFTGEIIHQMDSIIKQISEAIG